MATGGSIFTRMFGWAEKAHTIMWLAGGGGAMLTGVAGWLDGMPFAYVLALSAIVFCICAVGTYYMVRLLPGGYAVASPINESFDNSRTNLSARSVIPAISIVMLLAAVYMTFIA